MEYLTVNGIPYRANVTSYRDSPRPIHPESFDTSLSRGLFYSGVGAVAGLSLYLQTDILWFVSACAAIGFGIGRSKEKP